MPDFIDISDLDKAAVLAALYNNSVPQGMGFLQAAGAPDVMTIEQARTFIDGGRDATPDYGGISFSGMDKLYFDYVLGRPLKIDLTKDEFSPHGFDRDNGGEGTALGIINKLRETGDIGNGVAGTQQFRDRVVEKAFDALDMTTVDTTIEGGTFILGGSDVAEPMKDSVAAVVGRLG